jgi:sulfatase modifying factor 1
VPPPNTGLASIAFPETVPIPGGRIGGVAIAPFRLGRTPVTNREYAPLVAAGRVVPPPWSEDPDFCAPAQPVVGVTWGDAMTYARWLSERADGLWRLPTEAEWELAACGGLTGPRTAWGEAVPPGEIPEGALRGPWEVGRGTPNGFGLCDMGTIVHEWCGNRAAPARPGAPERRASRGGSWRHAIRWSSPSAASSLPPDFRYADYGFRVLREV